MMTPICPRFLNLINDFVLLRFRARTPEDLSAIEVIYIFFFFKEAVLKYRRLNSNVYSCFLDASKAFDRVNHYVLFDKLLKRGVPLYVVRILLFWNTTQTMYVRWNNVISSSFGVSNGVRQGGILSPYILFVYMYDLSNKLNDIKVGCMIGATLINHLMMRTI